VTAPLVLAVGVLGGLGAVARYLLDGAISRRSSTGFPLGILAVNLSGSLLLGVLAGAAVDGDDYTLLAGGLLGAYTTFSTWMLQTRRLSEDGAPALAALNILASLLLGLLVVWVGRELGAAI
jgi:CrcB protein